MATASPDPSLDDLNETYAGRWRVWRSVDEYGRHAAWCASNLDPASEWAPTLAATTLVALQRLIDSPPRRIRTALSDVQAPR